MTLNRRSYTFIFLVLLLAAAIAPALALRASETDDADGMLWCRIDVNTVNIRVTPNTANQPVTTLRNGDYFRAKTVQDNWLEIDWPRKVPAWVLKDTIQVSPADAKTGTVRSNRARILSQGMTNAQELAVLDRGAAVSIVAEKGDWLQVQAPANSRAYVYAKYVVVDVGPPAEIVSLPTVTKNTTPITSKNDPRLDPNITECVIVQQQAAWPKGTYVPIAATAKKQSEPKAVAPIAPAKIEPAPSVATAKKIEAPVAPAIVEPAPPVAAVKKAEASAAPAKIEPALPVAEPARAEAQAAPKPHSVELKKDKPLVLTASDFSGLPIPGENTDSAAPAIPTTLEKSAQSSAPKVAEGPLVIEVDDTNFGAEIEHLNGPVLIDFAATWCGPCIRTAPLVDEMAEEFRGKIRVAKVDIDRAPGLAQRFGVSSIPCLIILKAGTAQDRHVGAPSREFLKSWLANQK